MWTNSLNFSYNAKHKCFSKRLAQRKTIRLLLLIYYARKKIHFGFTHTHAHRTCIRFNTCVTMIIENTQRARVNKLLRWQYISRSIKDNTYTHSLTRSLTFGHFKTVVNGFFFQHATSVAQRWSRQSVQGWRKEENEANFFLWNNRKGRQKKMYK